MGWNRPKTFAEYIERYPDWHKRWLFKRHPALAWDEDLQQFLMLRALTSRRVERYDPKKRGGTDNERLFFNWMGNAYRLHCIFPAERSRCGLTILRPAF
jgi:hypothetical protein